MNEPIDREYPPKLYDAKYCYRIGAAVAIVFLLVCITLRVEPFASPGIFVILLISFSVGVVFQNNSCYYSIRPDYVEFRSLLAKFKLEYHEIVRIYDGDAGFCLQTPWGKVYQLGGDTEQVLNFLSDL